MPVEEESLVNLGFKFNIRHIIEMNKNLENFKFSSDLPSHLLESHRKLKEHSGTWKCVF